VKCGTIVPRQSDIVGERTDGYLAECVLERNHTGPHEFTTPEGDRYEWEDDDTCDCCNGDVVDPCYVYWKTE